MSKSTSVGVVDASYWTYMAAIMVERLETIVKSGRVRAKEIPKGVHRDAQAFFSLVLEAPRDVLPDNPPASISAYLLASDVLKESVDQTYDSSRINGSLEKYSETLMRLKRPHTLDENEVESVKQLKRFFFQLHQHGEAEEYERRFEDSGIGLRLLSFSLPR